MNITTNPQKYIDTLTNNFKITQYCRLCDKPTKDGERVHEECLRKERKEDE